MAEYTPSDDHMRSLFCQGYAQGDFDKHDQAWAAWEKWLAAHDARVRRDAAREALDGLLERATQRRARAMTTSSRERHEDIHFAVQEYRDTHYPEESP